MAEGIRPQQDSPDFHLHLVLDSRSQRVGRKGRRDFKSNIERDLVAAIVHRSDREPRHCARPRQEMRRIVGDLGGFDNGLRTCYVLSEVSEGVRRAWRGRKSDSLVAPSESG